MLELLTTGAAFAAALVAVWNRLRVGRYRDRWREAVRLNDDRPTGNERWTVRLMNERNGAQWVVTDGRMEAVRLAANFEYASLAPKARETADKLARDLNDGKIKVA